MIQDGMTQSSLLHTSWAQTLSAISSVVDVETARHFNAFQRPRKVQSAADLLRLALCYGAGLSLRQGSAWAESAAVAEVTNPGLLRRLRNAPEWLEHIATALMEDGQVQPCGTWAGYRLRVMDATSLCQPGADRTTWRLHVSYSLSGVVESVELTGDGEGETLGRFACKAGDICIGDRGYAKARGLRKVLDAGAHFVVRTGWQSLSWMDDQQRPLDLFGALGGVGDKPACLPVWVNSHEKGKPPLALRLIVARLPPEQAAKSKDKVAANIRKRCKTADPRSLEAAGFMMIVTTLDDRHSAEQILELYRLRWQVELLFKRFKSLADLGALPAKCPKLAKTWIYAKLILALLAEKSAKKLAESSPSGLYYSVSG